MTEERIAEVILSDGRSVNCRLEVARQSPWRLVFSGVELDRNEFAQRDPFSALMLLRRELEKIGAVSW
jgi:hypothetical protein